MAYYYMGQGKGQRKADKSPFWYLSILRFNRFGQWAIESVYVSEKQYNDVANMKFDQGTPVILHTEFGEFCDISMNKNN